MSAVPMSYDAEHPCPRCGDDWKVPARFPRMTKHWRQDEARWAVPDGAGWCSNPDCPMTEEERAAYRELRRENGWDPG